MYIYTPTIPFIRVCTFTGLCYNHMYTYDTALFYIILLLLLCQLFYNKHNARHGPHRHAIDWEFTCFYPWDIHVHVHAHVVSCVNAYSLCNYPPPPPSQGSSSIYEIKFNWTLRSPMYSQWINLRASQMQWSLPKPILTIHTRFTVHQ